MELYLRWLDKYERMLGEDPPIGLILCAAADAEQVELLQLDEKSIHVAEYLTELPPVQVLRERLHWAIAHAREQTTVLANKGNELPLSEGNNEGNNPSAQVAMPTNKARGGQQT